MQDSKKIQSSLLAAAALAFSSQQAFGDAPRRPMYSRGTQQAKRTPVAKPPMNGSRECARRRRQIMRGQLSVSIEVYAECWDRFSHEFR